MKNRLNLLPLAFQRRMLRRSQLRLWGIAAALCTALVAGACALQHHELHLQQRALELRRLRAAPLQNLQAQNEQLRQRLARLHEDHRVLADLDSEQLAVNLLSAVSRSAAACTDGVQVQQFSFSRTKNLVNVSPANPAAPPDRPQQTVVESLVMTLKGIGADNLTVSRFVVALRDSLLFEKVDLKSSTGGAGAARGVRSFVVECTL